MKHVIHKSGIGLGLMATSLGAFGTGAPLGLHTFAESSVYAKAAGTPLYASFIPSGSQSTDSLILLELTAGTGTALGTWQYFLSNGTLGAASNKPGMVYSLSPSNSITAWSITASVAGSAGLLPSGAAASDITYWGVVGNGSTTTNTAPGTSNGEILMGFTYSSVVTASQSATCNITFNAYVDTADYMAYQIAAQGISASNAFPAITSTGAANLSSASASFTITTKSSGATSDTVTGTYQSLPANNTAAQQAIYPQTILTGTSAPIPTYTYAQVSFSGAAGTGSYSMGSQALKQVQACVTQANARLALNSLGLIGGKQGLIRLW